MTEFDSRAADWDLLVADWQRSPAPRVGDDYLARLVLKQRRRMTLAVVADVLVSVLALAAAIAVTSTFPGPASTLLNLDVALMLVSTWTFALWNRRGLWRPLAETTERYVELALLRCRRRLAALRFAWSTLGIQVLIVGVWRVFGPTFEWSRGGPNVIVAIPALVVVGFALWIMVVHRRTRQEIVALEALAAGGTS